MCGIVKALVIVHVLFMLIGSIWLIVSSLLNKYLWNGDNLDLGAVRKDFSKRFPILPAARFPPLQMKTGGLFGQVHLLYASLSEILLIYHFPLRTSGDSGRHFMNISVTVVQGKVSAWNMKTATVEEHLPYTIFSSSDPASALLAVSYYMRAVYSNWNIQEYLTDAYAFAWTSANHGFQCLPQAFDIIRNALINMPHRLYQQGRQILGLSWKTPVWN